MVLPTPLQWIHRRLWRGECASNAAMASFSDYQRSKDIVHLLASIKNFQRASDQEWRRPLLAMTLINYAAAVWTLYDECNDKTPENLAKVILLGTQALKIWSKDVHSRGYILLAQTLAKAYFESYQKSYDYDGQLPSSPQGAQDSFRQSYTYFSNLKEITIGSDRRDAQMRLGILIRTRCGFEKKLDGLDAGIQNLEDVLKDTYDDSDLEDIKATCLYNLASAYEVRYNLGSRRRHESDSSYRREDLDTAIDYNSEARVLLRKLQRVEATSCTINLSRQLWLRWKTWRKEIDFDASKELAEAALEERYIDATLEVQVEEILDALKYGRLR